MSAASAPSFQLGAEHEAFRAEVRVFAESQFAAKAWYWDEHEEFPEENRRVLAAAGWFGLLIPPEYGGRGAPLIRSVLFVEEMARVCFNTTTICQIGLHGPARAIAVLGNEEQKRRFLPGCASGEHLFAISITEPGAGSATTDIETTARDDGDAFVLHGHKCFTTLGAQCTHTLVFARFGTPSSAPEASGVEGMVRTMPGAPRGAKGIGALIVDAHSPGITIGAADPKMGGRGAPECELRFAGVRVPKENVLVAGDPATSNGFRTLMSGFGPERVGNAAICVGLAQAAYERTLAFVKERKQFGRPIEEFQGLQWKIADMATQIHAARLMVYRAATNERDGFPDPRDTTIAKLYANEMVQRVTNEAIQIHGHRGYTRLYPLERMYRDARGYAVGGGTTEILRNTLAAIELGRTFDQRG
jgi:butyryl-CoA dehydrogenase